MSPDGFDLSAFKRPDRTTAPTPPPDAPRTGSAAPDVPEAADTPAIAPERPQTRPKATPAPTVTSPTGHPRRRAPRRPGPASDGRLVLALPVTLRDRARAVAASRGETYADVVLRAIQNTHHRLANLVTIHHATDTGPAIGDLFDHRTKARRTPEATSQVTIRGLSPHDRAVLDALVDQTGARTLTELVTIALDEDLPQRPRAIR